MLSASTGTSASASVHDREQHDLPPLQKQPFDFSLMQRNAMLARTGMTMPLAMKTGTTIAGVIYKDGVVLGADTRATEGSIVADKHCPKIHHISKYIHCCGAGTSADTESVTRLIQSQLELHRLSTGREPRVVTALTRLKQRLFQYQGYISAALVLGGIDSMGAHLYTVYPHGSTDSLPFATMGSGSLAAMAVFEARYRDDLNEDEAKQLVHDAISAGIYNDLGSGGDVNLMVISRTTGPQYLPKFGGAKNPRLYNRAAGYAFPRGSTEWLKDTERILKSSIVVTDVSASSSSSSSSSLTAGMVVEA